MTASAPQPTQAAPQPLLFADLPERLNENARRRRAAAKPLRQAATENTAMENAAAPAVAAPPVFVPSPVFEPAAMSNGELRALLADLSDARLAFVVAEAAKELKRRVAAPVFDPDEENPPQDPNPVLLRAAGAAVSELSGEDDAGYSSTAATGRRPAHSKKASRAA